jgi:hypothetical protein
VSKSKLTHLALHRTCSPGWCKLLAATEERTLYIEQGSPRENGYRESFNPIRREEDLNREIFHAMKELCVPSDRWRINFYTVRPDSSLGNNQPAPTASLTEASQRKGKVKTKERFPPFHHPHYGSEPSSLPAALR